jgi:hypothetical protein
MKEAAMDTLTSVLTELAPPHDHEMAEGYQRYAAALEPILTPQQLETYAQLIRRTGAVRVFEEMSPNEIAELSPDELAVATNIIADQAATMENRRVAALLVQRGAEDIVPDFVQPHEAEREA